MKLGFFIAGVSPRHYTTIAKRADELGYESLWMPEHLVFPASIGSSHPYAGPGAENFNPDTPAYDPFVIMGHVAAVTKNVKLGTGVYILPLRNPFVTARAAVTVDVLSEGRMLLGVGIGWLKNEFLAVGEAWENRSARAVEIAAILRKLWTEDTITHQGKYYKFDAVKFRPKPKNPNGIPLLFGGVTPPAIERAAQAGDGWFGVRHSLEEATEIIGRLKAHREKLGLSGTPFEITIGCPPPITIERIRAYEKAGVARMMVTPWGPPQGRLTVEHVLSGMEQFANDVLAKVR